MFTTFTALKNKCLELTQNIGQTNTNLVTFIENEINLAIRFIYASLQDYMTTKTQTTTTVASQQYYYMPPDIMNIESVKVLIGSVYYALDVVDSQRKWDKMNAIIFQGTAIPKCFFPRRDDFGIWPIPQAAYTVYLNYTYRIRDLSIADYTTGTITATNGSTSVVGGSTVWTSAMNNRMIKLPDGYPYRIASVTGNTALTLENYYQGTTTAGASYTIGEVPEIPLELAEIIPHRVASNYFSGMRKEPGMAAYWSNMFWTGDPQNNSRDMDKAEGGLLGAKKRYSTRSNSAVVRSNPLYDTWNDRPWATTLS